MYHGAESNRQVPCPVCGANCDGRHAEAGRKAHGRWRHRRLLRAARTHPGTEALRSLLILLCAGGLLYFLFGLGGGDHLGRRVVGARGRGVSSELASERRLKKSLI